MTRPKRTPYAPPCNRRFVSVFQHSVSLHVATTSIAREGGTEYIYSVVPPAWYLILSIISWAFCSCRFCPAFAPSLHFSYPCKHWAPTQSLSVQLTKRNELLTIELSLVVRSHFAVAFRGEQQSRKPTSLQNCPSIFRCSFGRVYGRSAVLGSEWNANKDRVYGRTYAVQTRCSQHANRSPTGSNHISGFLQLMMDTAALSAPQNSEARNQLLGTKQEGRTHLAWESVMLVIA